MNRTGLLIALAVAAAAGLTFGLYPKLDLILAEPFFNPATGIWAAAGPPAARTRDAIAWLIALIAAPAFVALIGKLMLPRRAMLLPGRAALLMIVTLALGPGLLANVILKDTWGRPRPIDVTEFRGTEHFVPWWDPRGECLKNCSFIAGEPSGAFWTLAPAAVAPPQWRVIAYGAALAFGSAVGVLRVAGGGHFVSDVVFAGVFMFLLIWLVHGLMYRWRPTAFADAAVERALECIAMPAYRLVTRLFTRQSDK
jgi:membrane-associated phospholipid phosphatase